MPPRALTCHACGRTLGTISRKRDQQGNPRDKLRLNDNAVKVGRELFRRQIMAGQVYVGACDWPVEEVTNG